MRCITLFYEVIISRISMKMKGEKYILCRFDIQVKGLYIYVSTRAWHGHDPLTIMGKGLKKLVLRHDVNNNKEIYESFRVM